MLVIIIIYHKMELILKILINYWSLLVLRDYLLRSEMTIIYKCKT